MILNIKIQIISFTLSSMYFCVLGQNPEEFITTKWVNEKTLLVSMGSDAITAIVTQKGIVVIDAGISASLTEKYCSVIEKELNRSDFTWLINTHGHSDHAGGNSVFSHATIIGHKNCKEEFLQNWKEPEKKKTSLKKIIAEYNKQLQSVEPGTKDWIDSFCQKSRYENALNDYLNNPVFSRWDRMFSDSLNLKAGDITLNMIYFGNAHSKSDIVIHIPELKLLFTGDLFFPYGKPSIDKIDKEDEEYISNSLKWMMSRRDEIVTIIGGHGQIMSIGDLDAFNDKLTKQLSTDR